MLTPDTIARIQALLDAATPGPVAVHRYDRNSGRISYQVQSSSPLGDSYAPVVCHHDESDTPRARADAALHAALRNAAPELLEAARERDAAVDHVRALLASTIARCDGCDKAATVGFDEGGSYCDRCAAQQDPDLNTFKLKSADAIRKAKTWLWALDGCKAPSAEGSVPRG